MAWAKGQGRIGTDRTTLTPTKFTFLGEDTKNESRNIRRAHILRHSQPVIVVSRLIEAFYLLLKYNKNGAGILAGLELK